VVLVVVVPPQAAMETANAATAEMVKTFFIIFLISSKDVWFLFAKNVTIFLKQVADSSKK
jgi:hypothetical protein